MFSRLLILIFLMIAPVVAAPETLAQKWQRILERNEIKTAQTLAAQGQANPYLRFESGERLLETAIYLNRVSIAKIILSSTREPGIWRDLNTLDGAADSSNLELLRYLLAKPQFDPNSLKTPEPLLFRVVRHENLSGLQLLLQSSRVKANILDNQGNTVLHVLDDTSDPKIAQVLLGVKGLDPNTANQNGDTPLHFLAEANPFPAVLQTVLDDSRLQPNLKNRNGETALGRAIAARSWRAIALLLADKRVDPTDSDRQSLRRIATK